MERFKIFLSHCAGDGPEKDIVKHFFGLLCKAFEREKVRQTLDIMFDGDTPPVLPGGVLRPGLVNAVKSSDLVICCFFPRYREASYFKEEVATALSESKPIIEIRFIPAGESPYSGIEQFDKRLVEKDGSGHSLRVLIEIQYDSSDPSSAKEPIGKYVEVGRLVDAIRKQMIERAERNLTMFSRAGAVIDDLAGEETRSIRFFLYDGGTTIRNLHAHEGFKDLLKEQRENLTVEFLYVDTACKTYISETPEYKGSATLQAMDDGAYSAVYEALCRQSGLVHNQSPHGHLVDVSQSKEILQALKDEYGFKLSIRKTCQLPIYRLIISQNYVYYTHILSHFALVAKLGAPEYYSLRLSTDSSAGKDLIRHYERLWNSGAPEPSDA